MWRHSERQEGDKQGLRMRRERPETWDAGKMPDRSAEAGEEERAGEASSYHMCACIHMQSLKRTIKIEKKKRPGFRSNKAYWCLSQRKLLGEKKAFAC